MNMSTLDFSLTGGHCLDELGSLLVLLEIILLIIPSVRHALAI